MHPAVTATGCVALWNVLQHSEQARAIAKGTAYGSYTEEGETLVGVLRDTEYLRIKDSTCEMDQREGRRGGGVRGADNGHTHSRGNVGASQSPPLSPSRLMLETTSAARTALLQLIE